jgi:hypothetical protein
MYCPKCATPLADDQKFCRSCGFDLQVISRFFTSEPPAIEPRESEFLPGGGSQSLKEKLHRRAMITIISALLVGCTIPIAIGLLSGYGWLNQLILVLSGIAGFLLFSGCIVMIYADGLSKKEGDGGSSRPSALWPSKQTNQLPPEGRSEPVQGITEHTTDLLETSKVKGPRERK